MSDELWSDERIRSVIKRYVDPADMAIAMRDDYEGYIAELEARLTQTWQPDDLAFTCGAATVGQIGNQLLVELYGETLQVDIPDDIRLCRLVSEPQGDDE